MAKNSFYGTYSFQDVFAYYIPMMASGAGSSGSEPIVPGFSIDLAQWGVDREGITIAPVETRNIMATGADDSVIHNLVTVRPGTCTIRLLKVSPLNKALSDRYNAATTSAKYHGWDQIIVRDVARQDEIILNGCAFQNPPEIVFAREGSTNEWVFDVAQMVIRLGDYGNSTVQMPTTPGVPGPAPI